MALPAELMNLVDLRPGDSVYLQANPDKSGTLVLVPVEMAARWFETGRQADRDSAGSTEPGAPIDGGRGAERGDD